MPNQAVSELETPYSGHATTVGLSRLPEFASQVMTSYTHSVTVEG